MPESPLERRIAGEKPPVTSFSASAAVFDKAIADKAAASKESQEAPPAAKQSEAAPDEEVNKSASQPTLPSTDSEGAASPTHSKDAPAEPWTKKTSENWKAREKSFRERENALLHEISTLKAATGDTNLAKLKAENETLRAAVRAIDAERDPLFQQEWSSKKETATARLRSVAPQQADKLAVLAALPAGEERDKLVSDVLNDMPAWKQSQVGQALYEIGKLSEEKSALLRSSEERLQAEAQKRALDQRAEKERAIAVFDDELEDWQASLSGFDEEKLKGSVDLARAIFSDDIKEPKKKARLAVWGALGPLLIQDSLGKDKVIAELQGQIKALQAAQPAAGGSSAPVPEPEDASKGRRGSFGATVAEAAKKQGFLIN
jgi:hypothetical protein